MEHTAHGIVMAPADRSNAGNKTEPVHKQNKNKNGREEPERLSDKIAPDNVFEKVIKTFNQPFPKILDAAGNRLDLPCGELRENNNPSRDNPRHQHRVCDRKLAEVHQLCWL